jgi:hypothetical protein
MSELRIIEIQIIESLVPEDLEYRAQIHVKVDGKEISLLKTDHPHAMQAAPVEPLQACKSIYQWINQNLI